MTPQVLSSRLTAEGRALVPAEVRKALGATAGSRLLFVLEEGGVRVISAEQMQQTVWANNHGGDAANAVDAVRAMREADHVRDDEVLDAQDEDGEDTRTPEEVTSGLFASLGLPLPADVQGDGPQAQGSSGR